MSDEARVLVAFVLPLLASLACTPLAIRVAGRANFHDLPLGYKGHSRPTPYLGGAAVLVGFLAGALLLGGGAYRLAPVAACALGLWIVGTIDDRVALSPLIRVAAEATAAAILFGSGLGWSIFDNGLLDLALTVVWIVGLVNAFNLMDNMDGAASTIAALSSLGVAVLAIVLGDVLLGALAIALCGACLGFLPYNLAGPARIFLGDGGSMPIGFVVGATAMILPLSDFVGWQRLLAAVLLAGLPILDTTLVVFSRRRAGVPLFRGGRDHLTHRLNRHLASARGVALTLGGVQAALCAAAFGVTQLGDLSTVLAWMCVLAAAAVTVVTLEGAAWAPVRPVVLVETGLTPGESPVAEIELRPATPAPPLATPTGDTPLEPGTAGRGRLQPVGSPEAALIVLVAISCGLSPFLYGFYNLSTWGPIALGLLAVLFGLVIARPAVPRVSALVAVGGLVGLWAWSLLSTIWSESADQALTEANRWMLYAALLAILLLLLRSDGLGRLLLGTTTVFVVGLGAYVVGAMLVGEGGELFLLTRLHEPLGYANGQAAYFLLGLWPLVAAAERARSHLLAGASAGAATMLASLVLLTQTRAIVPALALSALLLVALVPGRGRRLWVLAVIGGGVALAAGPVLAVFEPGAVAGESPPEATLRSAATATVLVALTAGAVWALARAGADRLAASGQHAARRLRVASVAALVTIALVGVAGLAAAVDEPVQRVADQYRTFTELRSQEAGTSRFTSGGGNRYDYWRIAVAQLRDEPLHGVGAGNYDRTYFLERRTREDIRQAHSIELQVLGELGLVGGIALALFVGSVLLAFVRRAFLARRDPGNIAMAVAGGGMFLTWLVHTSVDWLHLIPGVTGIALCGAAVLLAPWARERAQPVAGRTRRVVTVFAALLVAFAAVQLGRSTLADHNRSQGQEALVSDPTQALNEADAALALDDEALSTYYLQAAAYARLDDYEGARASLFEATRREPHDFVTWALLGDLAVRRGDIAEARRNYVRAAGLNPRDLTLAELARDPRSALDPRG